MAASFAFETFVLDTGERRLLEGGRRVELNGRYLDALALMVNEPGKLVSKDRFLGEVWKGIPVTDEALTQCIRTLRRTLGDDAGKPRFIETVPKHGYRFIAPVKPLGDAPSLIENDARQWREFLILGSAGTIGGALAGAIGGLIYGFAVASASGVGALSVLLVLLCVTLLVAVLGGLGVSFGLAFVLVSNVRSLQRLTLAGAAGGLFVGAFGKLLALDAFTLLVGRSPAGITGALEGLFVGAGAGFGTWLALRDGSLRGGSALAGLAGAAFGLAISLLGGRLMLGSLELVAETFPGSHLRLDQFARLLGEAKVGTMTRFGSTILEAALFSSCVVAAMMLARRSYVERKRTFR